MSLSQMQVFNDFVMPATLETLDQMTDAFNQASNGAIVLSPNGFTGDYLQESFFQNLASAQRRVDRYAANSAVSATDLTELKNTSVKIAGGFGPVRYEPSQMTWLQRPTAQGIEVASRAFAEILLKDQLNTAIAALVAAITAQAAAVNDVSATAGITQAGLNNAHAKFGGRSALTGISVSGGWNSKPSSAPMAGGRTRTTQACTSSTTRRPALYASTDRSAAT